MSKRAQQIVDHFNQDFPVGTPVILQTDSGARATRVRHPAYLMNGSGTPVAFFVGIAGCYAIEGRVIAQVASDAQQEGGAL